MVPAGVKELFVGHSLEIVELSHNLGEDRRGG